MRGFLAFGRKGLGSGGLAALLLVLVACGGNVEAEGDGRGGGGNNGGSATTQGGAASVKGGAPSTSGGASSMGGGTTTGGVTSDVDPSSAVAGAATTGSGQCAGHSLGEVVMNIHAKHPELGDIDTFYDPMASVVGGGNFIYAFPHDDGFRLIFTRGSGDCESGCIDMEYSYFETREGCFPYRVGFYSRTYVSGRNCVALVGMPMWGFPGAPPPGGGCGQMPANISGTYELTGLGAEYPCSLSANPISVIATVALSIEQESNDLSRASVFINKTGNDLLDGQSFTARVSGSALHVEESITRGDDEFPDCGATLHLSLDYDFARMSGNLRTEEVRYLDCTTMDYCKGGLQLSLTKQ